MNFRANGTAVTFLEELHYYPFGMLMEGIGTAAVTVNAYKYNSKELNTDLGLNWSDYGARWYDASVGRWWSVDPLAEKYLNYSVYTYVANNPILIIDPNGMELYISVNDNYGQAVSDILRLINSSKFSGKVSINFTTPNDGNKHDIVKAEVSFIGISQETVSNDVGLNLLNNLSTSDNKYLYEVGTSGNSIDRTSETSEETPTYMLGTPNQKGGLALNLSKTDRGDTPSYNIEEAKILHKIFNGKPKGGFDAHVIISPFAGDAKQSNNNANIPREWFVFHELSESYNRTDKKMTYKNAHNDALSVGKYFYLTPKDWDQKVSNPYAKTYTTSEIREKSKKD